MTQRLLAGAAQFDITPQKTSFLHGYPHVARSHTGVHDRLFTSVLWLDDGRHPVAFVGNDLLYLPNDLCRRARRRIAREHAISVSQVMITASHTHSGPVTTALLASSQDPVVPPPDEEYLRQLEDTLVRAAAQAASSARPATLAATAADGTGLGTNRRDPNGPRIGEIPVLAAYETGTGKPIAIMAVCAMHPTVLHEDSTSISGDFPGLARRHLQRTALAPDCPFVYHMGAAGNQSPRHVVRENTFAQADRLGRILADGIAAALASARPVGDWNLQSGELAVDLPVRTVPHLAEAQRRLTAAEDRLDRLRRERAERAVIRTAEVDWFGAQELLTISQAAQSGQLQRAVEAVLPATVQLIRVGDIQFVGWPGEVFVEFALQLRQRFPRAHVITAANGHLEGYLVTQQAIDEKAYEAGNALFASPESGERLVAASLKLLGARR